MCSKIDPVMCIVGMGWLTVFLYLESGEVSSEMYRVGSSQVRCTEWDHLK